MKVKFIKLTDYYDNENISLVRLDKIVKVRGPNFNGGGAEIFLEGDSCGFLVKENYKNIIKFIEDLYEVEAMGND